MIEFVRDKPRNTVRSGASAGGHYSWDWHDVHFVQLNVAPANGFIDPDGPDGENLTDRLSDEVIAPTGEAWITEMGNDELMDLFKLTL